MLSIYPAYFCKEDSGYSVIFPDLNYLSTCGETLEEAMEMAVDCLAGRLYLCRQLQEPVFPPSKPEALRPEEYLKNIYGDLPVPDYFITMVSVDVDAYAREHFEKSIKKTLTIPAWLNQEALKRGLNFSKVLQEALKERIRE